MGIQSAAVRRLNLPGVATTYVTGTMTTLIASITSKLRRSSPKPAAAAPARDGHTRLQAAVLVIYGFAAFASGVFQTRIPWLVAVLPLAAVGVVLLLVSLHHKEHESRATAE
jgi:uncharacterized membrane protein YoaK (UPF0700 family)